MLDIVKNFTDLEHGDCIGVDAQTHEIAKGYHMNITVHPPTDSHFRAFCDADTILNPRAYLKRNKNIVDRCGTLLVVPDGMFEKIRSGTWSTWRYAVKTHTPWIIVYPDGTISREDYVCTN
jgi:hypothetical protein